MTENQRLKIIQSELGFKSQASFAQALSLTPGGLSDILREKPGVGVSDRTKRILEKSYNISLDWLETGKGEMYITSIKPKPVMEAVPVHLAADPSDPDNDGEQFEELGDGTLRMRIPIIPNKAFANGYLIGYHEPEFFEDLAHVSIEVQKRHKGNYLAFEVKGDSMTSLEPKDFRRSIFDGVIVVGRELPRIQWRYKLHMHDWDFWIIVHKEQGIMVKQIIKHDVDNGLITIHSLNPDKKQYPDRDLHLDDIEQMFNIVKKIDEA